MSRALEKAKQRLNQELTQARSELQTAQDNENKSLEQAQNTEQERDEARGELDQARARVTTLEGELGELRKTSQGDRVERV